jgi:hypothetical protein
VEAVEGSLEVEVSGGAARSGGERGLEGSEVWREARSGGGSEVWRGARSGGKRGLEGAARSGGSSEVWRW